MWKLWPEPRLTLSPPRQITRDSGLATEPSLSADGRLLAYASDRGGEGNLDVWLQELLEPMRASAEETR